MNPPDLPATHGTGLPPSESPEIPPPPSELAKEPPLVQPEQLGAENPEKPAPPAIANLRTQNPEDATPDAVTHPSVSANEPPHVTQTPNEPAASDVLPSHSSETGRGTEGSDERRLNFYGRPSSPPRSAPSPPLVRHNDAPPARDFRSSPSTPPSSDVKPPANQAPPASENRGVSYAPPSPSSPAAKHNHAGPALDFYSPPEDEKPPAKDDDALPWEAPAQPSASPPPPQSSGSEGGFVKDEMSQGGVNHPVGSRSDPAPYGPPVSTAPAGPVGPPPMLSQPKEERRMPPGPSPPPPHAGAPPVRSSSGPVPHGPLAAPPPPHSSGSGAGIAMGEMGGSGSAPPGPGQPLGPRLGAQPYAGSRPPASSASAGPVGPPPMISQTQEERRIPPGPSPPPLPPHATGPPVRSSSGQHPPATAARPPPPSSSAPPARFRPPPAAPPTKPPPPPPATGGMRELRVEDALLYLDDVKREFGDRPRIYNEFLEIMKNFKSQEVDTPGVIRRVSKLFRGYNNLILGFNKFLPDGYKITIADIDKSNAEHRREQEAAAAAAAAAGASHGGQSGYYPGGPQQRPPGGAQGHGLQMKSGGPAVQGQIARDPSTARQGGPSPPQSFQKRGQPPPQGEPPATMGRPGQKAGAPGSPHDFMQQQSGTPPQPQQQQQQQQAGSSGQPPNASQQMAPPGPRGVAQQAPQHQAVEFDHAISYVTNIKKRFANDPSTYHSFLEILHTYQKEQRGIKEVLEQVAALFADHPDLLKEFTFFLPDAVQGQAKERLHRAAADSEARQAAAMEQRGVPYGHVAPGFPQNRQHLPPGSQKIYDMTGATEQARDVSPTSRQGLAASRKRPFSPSGGAPMVPIHPPHPETFVYNSAVERQFFDAVKEALTSYSRDGGQGWAEFLKCLDMYAQEILSRSEMLNFVEPLLGKRHSELFEEFKNILTAAAAQSGPAPSSEDSWYSVPLSEIDFSRCRKCSPSYRALPRDYPAPPTSERSELETKILNDIWVSLPVGSEESYTFRHMRRNTYEETLFRCEDERFEIDMVIDSNASTLRRLEPIAEEIEQLSQEEMITPELSIGNGSRAPAGMGGKKFQYTFDQKRVLGVIQRNSIARIYGDAGQEMLDLMVKNPTVAIPVVVQRLRQKDREWKAAREGLNRHWKELAEMNYYKSLDNRALTWRTTDKRATSTRTLVAEIKDRAAHNGHEGEAAVTARLDKAKEEHGSFYEVTMREHLTKKLDLTNLPKPDSRLFTPHLSLMYESNSWAQRDAYRIIAFALERGATSPADKERCHRLWREFLGPWFDLSLNWMQRPALDFCRAPTPTEDTPIVVSNGEEENIQEERYDEEESSSADEAEMGKNVVTEELRDRGDDTKEGVEMDSPMLMDHHALPPGAKVSTIYGEGTILQYRRPDHTYKVALPFGATAYLQPSAVLCSVLSAEKSGFTNRLRSEDDRTLERPDDVLVIGTQSLYLFFRLHQILIRRLKIAKDTAYKVCTDKTLSTLVEQMKGDPGQDMGKKRYDACLSLVYALVAGGHNAMGSSAGAAEGGKYEDRVRCLLGHGAYELATMDKLISHIVKNLQNMAGDETMQNLIQLFRRHLDAGSFKPGAFREEAAYLSDGENMFAFQYCKIPDSDKTILHTEYLGVIEEDDEDSEDHLMEGVTTATSEEADADAAIQAPPAKRQRRGYKD